MIMHCDDLIATPINLGSSELVTIDGLVTIVETIAGVKPDENMISMRRVELPVATATIHLSNRS